MTLEELAVAMEKARYEQLRGGGWEELREGERRTRVDVCLEVLRLSGAADMVADLQARLAEAEQRLELMQEWNERLRAMTGGAGADTPAALPDQRTRDHRPSAAEPAVDLDEAPAGGRIHRLLHTKVGGRKG